MYRLGLAVLWLFASVLPAAAEKQIVQFDSVLFVREGGITGRTSIVLFDNGTAQVLASKVLTPTYGMADFFPSSSMEAVGANEWASDVIHDCPSDRACIRWRSIGVLRSSKKDRPEFGLGVSGAVGSTYLWVVPVSLAISDVSSVVGFGDSSLKTEKDWRDYADKWEEAQAKAVEQQKQAEYQALKQQRQKEADAEASALAAERQLHACLLNLKEGDPASKVYSCGYPDHTNSDLHTDQLVYPEDVFVYIDKATNRISDVQWTH